jgi:hypothetical protein
MTEADLAALFAARPHLFSAMRIVVSAAEMAQMRAIIRAVEEAVARPAYQEAALSRVPAVAHPAFGPRGVFFGYDFHFSPTGPRLVEINTNAGGALLNLRLARARPDACRDAAGTVAGTPLLDRLEEVFFAMFLAEWRRQRGDAPLRRIAIVDETAAEQYLYPEFLLFRDLFRSWGVDAVIVEPQELSYRDGTLWAGNAAIDMVYNRLVDFYLESPASAALGEAYRAGAVVLTPHPHAYALYADKRNLVLLSDRAFLRAIGLPGETAELLLAAVPRTVEVGADNADALWAERRRLFFKPARGCGGRGSYRGAKLTRGVWEEIRAGGYVAQDYVPPGEVAKEEGQPAATFKVDVRTYVYAGEVQLVAARLYQGQTTNFRTPGGGFAVVCTPPWPMEIPC